MNGLKPIDCHHFNALVQIGSDSKTQSYIVEVSLNHKLISYVVKEKVIHSIPFLHVVRLSCSASSLTLHVRGERLGEVQALLHIVNDEDAAPLAAFLTAHCLNDNGLTEYEHILSPFPTSLIPIHAGSVTKKGFWGGDATRHATLVPHRLLLHRTQGSAYPLTVLMMTDIVSIERKGRRRMRLCGAEREWELGFEDELSREEFYLRIETEKLESGMRVIAWRRKRHMIKKAEEEESKRAVETSHSCSHSAASVYDNHVQPVITSSFTTAAASMNKRRSMPSPTPTNAVSAHVLAAKAKRSSLNIRTNNQMPNNKAPISPMSNISPSFSHMSINHHSPSFTSSVANYRGDEQLSPFPYSPRLSSMNSPINMMLRSPSAAGPYNSSPRLSPSPIHAPMSARYHSTSPIPPISPSNNNHLTQRFSSTSSIVTSPLVPIKALSTHISSECWKFTIFVRGFDEPLGQITVIADSTLTLAYLRQAIIDELDDVPDEFQFTEDDALTNTVVPISIKQEKNRFLETVPQGSLFIRVKQTRGSLSDQSKPMFQHTNDKCDDYSEGESNRKTSMSFTRFSVISEAEKA